MPIYEYECSNGHRIEVLQRLDDPGPERCATCGAALHKLLAPPAIVFKGTGWAKKDARASARAHAPKGDGDGKREDGKREDGKAAAGAGGGSAGSAGDDTAASSGKEHSSAGADGGSGSGAATSTAPAGEAKGAAR